MSDEMLKKIKFHLEKALAACDEAYDDEGDDEEESDDTSDDDYEEESPKKKKESKVDLAIAFMGPKKKE